MEKNVARNRSLCVSHSIFRMNVYLPFMYLMFFVNSIGLPAPLEYTTILSPIFYVWLRKKKQKWVVTPFVICSLPFILIHLKQGVDARTYVISYVYIMAIYLVAFTFYVVVSKTKKLNDIFENIIVVNFILSCLSIVLINSQYSDLLWWKVSVGSTLGEVKRLKLFTYEASYYSTILVPYFVYSYFNVTLYTSKKNILLFVCTLIPLAMSFSFGIISSLSISIVLVHIIYMRKIYYKNKIYTKTVLPVVLLAVLIAILKTPFYDRLADVLAGRDMSGTGRTYFSTIIAFEVARQKSLWWGVGFGQTKSFYDIMVSYMEATYKQGWMNEYLYNSIADLFAATGIIGTTLKIVSELYLFIKTKVFSNYFRVSLFICIFVYQFTGSYLTNIAEYVLWIFTFSRVFPEFNTCRIMEPLSSRAVATQVKSAEVA